MPNHPKRTIQVTFWLAPNEKELYARAAHARRMSLSEWIRWQCERGLDEMDSGPVDTTACVIEYVRRGG